MLNSLVSKFNIRIKYQTKAGRKENVLTEEEKEWLVNFFDRADITYTTPGRKDHVYIGKLDGIKKFVQKRYLLWTIRDILEIANGSQEEGVSDTFCFEFDKGLTFRQLYGFFKYHKQYVYNKNIPQSSCLCEVCENVVLLSKGINKALISDEKALPTNPHELVEKFSCDSSSRICMFENCEKCNTSQLSIDDFKNAENV